LRSGASPKPSLIARAAGHACVAMLSALRRIPPRFSRSVLSPLLKVYPHMRPAHSARLRACFAASPFAPGLSLDRYYAARLELLLRGLELHGAPLDGGLGAKAVEDAAGVDGARYYRNALAADRPIALIGLHAGVLELLHRVPDAPADRPFLILTAPAFAPALTAYMARGRERDGKRILWIGGRDASRGLESGLREVIGKRGVLALMADQHPGDAEACEYLTLWDRVRVPWPARLMGFLESQGFQCLPVSTFLDAGGEPLFRFHAPLESPSEAAVRAFLEAAIAEAPEQWNWSYPKVEADASRPPA
jgi:hypothetical protein